MLIGIDGDIIVYRSLFSRDADSPEDAKVIADSYIDRIRAEAHKGAADYMVYLSGRGAANYRHAHATTLPYKGNRPKKPEGLEVVREHLIENHPSVVSVEEEADDRLAIDATRLGNDYIICSIDKDLDQVPGWHYNFVKHEHYHVSKKEGLLFFYCQLLIGDRADNIQGAPGIGPVKARKALEGLSEYEMYQKCVELLESPERVLENARLCWLRREEGQLWQPPESPVEPKDTETEEDQKA